MDTQKIWRAFNHELYFFILKKVKDKDAANDIFQNTFLKIHKNLSKLKTKEKVKAWIFQIARNEIANHFNKESLYVENISENREVSTQAYQHICCFDNFMNELPEPYNQVIELIYVKGKKQKEVAQELNISLENVKIRIKRAKDLLKKKLHKCCKFEFDKQGKLIGESNCATCENY